MDYSYIKTQNDVENFLEKTIHCTTDTAVIFTEHDRIPWLDDIFTKRQLFAFA